MIKYPKGRINIDEIIASLHLDKEARFSGDFKFYTLNYSYKQKAFISFLPKVVDDEFPEDSIRLEFNPNNFDISELGWFLSKLPKKEHVNYNRVDFAVDIQKTLLPQFFYDKNKRNTHYYYVGGDCETAYIGSQLSDIQYRIYDKRKEVLKEEGLYLEKQETLEKDFFEYFQDVKGIDIRKPLFRVEVQLRKKILNKIEKNFWAGLCYYEAPDFSPESTLKPKYKWFLAYCQIYGSMPALKDIDSHYRAPYQNLFKVVMYDDFYQDSVSQFRAYDLKIKHLIGNDIYE